MRTGSMDGATPSAISLYANSQMEDVALWARERHCTKARLADDRGGASPRMALMALTASVWARICSLTGQIALSDSEHTAVKAVREEETKICSKSEDESVGVVDTLKRAICITLKERTMIPFDTRSRLVCLWTHTEVSCAGAEAGN